MGIDNVLDINNSNNNNNNNHGIHTTIDYYLNTDLYSSKNSLVYRAMDNTWLIQIAKAKTTKGGIVDYVKLCEKNDGSVMDSLLSNHLKHYHKLLSNNNNSNNNNNPNIDPIQYLFLNSNKEPYNSTSWY